MALLGLLTGGDDPGDGGVRIDSDNKYEALHEAVRRILVVTHWDDRLPDSMTARQYRGLIAHAADAGSRGYTAFDKEALRAIAAHLGATHRARDTTRELRRAIADEAGFDYESPDSYIRAFAKDELKTLAAAAVRERHREEGR